MKSFNEFKNQIARRNRLETTIAGIITPIFLLIAFYEKQWIRKLLFLEVALSSLFVCFYILNNSSKNLKRNITNKVDESNIIRNEIKILKRTPYWYVLPLFIGLFSLMSLDLYSAMSLGDDVVFLVVNVILMILICCMVIYLNRIKGVKALEQLLVQYL